MGTALGRIQFTPCATSLPEKNGWRFCAAGKRVKWGVEIDPVDI